MRQGIGCALWEREPGSLAELRRCLEAWRFVCADRRDRAGTAAEPLLVAEIRGEALSELRAAFAAQQAAGGAVLALCDGEDLAGHSLAAALGCDDILAIPLDPVELVRRLQTLSSLVALGAERSLREHLFAAYRDQRAGTSFRDVDEGGRPLVAFLGRPSDAQVRLIEALPAARRLHVEAAERLGPSLASGEVDLLLVTEPALLDVALARVEAAAGDPPFLLAAHTGAPWALELPPAVDLLPLPAPMPVLRARLALVLRIAAARRWLRDPPLGDVRPLLVDALTGLYDQGFFLDYLRATGEERAVIALEHDRLDWVNRESGYGEGNRILARIGRSLRRRVRAHDIAAHLGGGRFAVAVSVAGRDKLERLHRRLQATVAEDEPWQILSAAEAMPPRGAPAHRLSRLFSDLRRLRPAA